MSAPGRAAVLNDRFGGVDAPVLLAAALGSRMLGPVALVSSFGAESVVLLHMVAEIDPDLPVLFLDTEMLFSETLTYQRAVAAQLGLSNVQRIRPGAVQSLARDPEGALHRQDPDACCALRKSEPLARALRPYDSWITGRKRFQSQSRAALPVFEAEAGRIKINPLAGWDAERLAAYMERHALPRHPLVARGYASIGCAPCTGPVSPGEPARAGRWRGRDKVECGIHFADGRAVRAQTQGATA